MKSRRNLLAVLLVAVLAYGTPLLADSSTILKAAYKLLEKIAAKTPATKIFLEYHQAHLKSFKAVVAKVEGAKKMGKDLNDLESNFHAFFKSTNAVIVAANELPNDPLSIMGTRVLATKEDIAFVRQYVKVANDVHSRLAQSLKTVKQIRSDYEKLERAINAQKDFTRKFLNEELTLFEKSIMDKYGPRFSTLLSKLQTSIESEMYFTLKKIDYAADILR